MLSFKGIRYLGYVSNDYSKFKIPSCYKTYVIFKRSCDWTFLTDISNNDQMFVVAVFITGLDIRMLSYFHMDNITVASIIKHNNNDTC